jgi:hypothetical protein
MTITYANGTVCKAIMLSHEQDEIRAVTSASDDAQILRRVKGMWFSEEIEPVAVEFEWQPNGSQTTPSVDNCICSKEIAARFIQRLLADGEGEDPYQGSSATSTSHYGGLASRQSGTCYVV